MTATVKQPTRSNGDRTKKKLLDAAEKLFGDKGFDAVSLRDITVLADVTLALASYHFGTKEKLFEAVIGRRASVLCDLRRERLAALGETPTSREILKAFIAPLFEQVATKKPGWSSYVRVLARLGEDDRWLDLLSEHFDDVARLFLATLSRTHPQSDPERLARGFTMTLQLMLSTVSRHRRLDRLTHGAARADDLDAALRDLLDFVDGGFSAVFRPH